MSGDKNSEISNKMANHAKAEVMPRTATEVTSGTEAIVTPKTAAKIFVVLVMVLLMIPSVGMLWAKTETSMENTALAEFPHLKNEEGNLNNGFLAQAGEWFDDHYAYRNQFLNSNSLLTTRLTATSPVEKVIYGKDGWLYFNGTLDDYQGRNILSERDLAGIAHNLALIQEYVEDRGGTFVFTIALNKNSIYADSMPSRFKQNTITNRKLLKPYLQEQGINYIDLEETLASAQAENPNQLLYYKRDTHWNAIGARAAYNAIMVALEQEHEDYLGQEPRAVSAYVGDINRILYPLSSRSETEYLFDTKDFAFLTEAEDIENDGWLVTGSQGVGTLLMFRDSFTNALFPFLAGEFQTAFFSKLEPYNLANVDRFQPDCVVIERVERNLADLVQTPAIMVAPRRVIAVVEDADVSVMGEPGATLATDTDGSYTVFKGAVSKSLISTDDTIYLALTDVSGQVLGIYESFWIQAPAGCGTEGDPGFLAYLRTEDLPASYGVSILVGEAGGATAIKVL